jgi:endonuclease YncB( thermonuclease family)
LKRFRALFVVVALFVSESALALENADPACQHDRTTFRCVKYLKNYDADTITVHIHDVHPLLGDKISVRVLGVDTPEVKGHLPCEKEAARAAKRLVESLLKQAKRIDLNEAARDKYFRILADVNIDGKSLSAILLKNGLGYPYQGKTKEKINWCKFGSGNQL